MLIRFSKIQSNFYDKLIGLKMINRQKIVQMTFPTWFSDALGVKSESKILPTSSLKTQFLPIRVSEFDSKTRGFRGLDEEILSHIQAPHFVSSQIPSTLLAFL